MLGINPAVFSKIVGILLLLSLPLIFFNRSKLENKKVTTHLILGTFFYSLIAIYGGFFGAGGGIAATYILIFGFGMTYVEAIGTSRLPLLVSLFVSFCIFAANGLINYKYGILLLTGNLIGGYIGSYLAIKKGERFVKIVFASFVILSSIKLLFFN